MEGAHNVKKILFIIKSFTKGGGAESLLTTVVNNLNPEKYKIDIIEIVHDDIKVERVNENITILPYIMRTDDPKRKEKMYYVYHEPEKVFNKFVKKDYDLYVSFNYQRPTFLLPHGKKNISWIHGDVYNLLEEEKNEERKLQDEAFDKVNKIVAISDRTMQSIMDLFPRHKSKIIKIYNGIDNENVVKKSKEKCQLKFKKPSVLFIGRLEPNKQPERLLHIEVIYKEKYKEYFYLYYLGYGVLEDELRDKVRKIGANDYIQFLGYKENPFPYIKQADICALLSKSEGFSMALLESQTLGKPILTTPVGAAETMVMNPYCGAIVDSDEEAAREIFRILSSNKEKIEDACIQSADRFTLKKYIDNIEKLFDKVIES